MDIFSLFTLCGGLAFFLYGMDLMSKSLEKMAGGKLEHLLKRMTSSPLKSLLLGAVFTAIIQSSSAVTVMLVGLVNSGVMQLSQTIGVIMGSNIGTTATAWILSLAGIESDNVFVKLLKPANFSPLLALIGIMLIMASKKQRRRDVGRVLMGFAIFGSGFFTALNDGLTSALISFLRTLVFQIAAVLILPLLIGIDGIWMSIVVAEFMAVVLTFLFLKMKQKKYGY